VKVIEAMNSRMNKDYLFSGKQIHMAKRDLLTANGPFKNIYRGEDRDLYERLALSNQWVTISHERFIDRIERKKQNLIKMVGFSCFKFECYFFCQKN
jgi:hypothetical protein